jgi:hypothetical protein
MWGYMNTRGHKSVLMTEGNIERRYSDLLRRSQYWNITTDRGSTRRPIPVDAFGRSAGDQRGSVPAGAESWES